MLAVNDAPVRTSPELAPLIITRTSLDYQNGSYLPIPLGLQAIAFHAGGNLAEQNSQQLEVLINALPPLTLGQVVLVDGVTVTAVVQGQTYSLDQLRRMRFLTDVDALALAADARLSSFRFIIRETGAIDGGSVQPTEESLPIYVSGNGAAAKALEVLLALLGENPNPGVLKGFLDDFDAAAASLTSSDGIETLDPTVYSRLDPSNPLFMNRASGATSINGQKAHFLPNATPVNFSFNIARAPNNELVDLDSTRFGVQTSYLIAYSTEPTPGTNDIELKQLPRSSEQGRAFDRYFKFISEQTLRAYGARMDLDGAGNVQYNVDGEVLYTWEGVPTASIGTKNQQPLTTLDGQIIKAAGYYDFTRSGAIGDGGVFEYVTLDDGFEYIKSVNVHFTDNMFGDNNPVDGVIVDPGVTVALLPVIGNSTSITTLSNTSFLNGGGVGAGSGPNVLDNSFTLINALDRSSSAASERLDPSLLVTSGGSSAAMSFGGSLSSAGDGGEGGEGLANGEEAGTAQLAGVGAAAGQGSPALQAMLGQGLDQGPKSQPDRSSLLQPLISSPASAEATAGHGSFVVGRLQEGSLMGNHLLDALALGMGVVYGFYGPKAALASNAGMRGLLRRAQQLAGSSFGTAAGRERQLISVFAIKLDNGSERLVAARVTSTGLVILAQQDLPPGAGMATPGSQAQIDYSMRQLLDRLRGSGLAQAEQVLVDPQLQAQTSLLKGLGTSTAQLVTRSLSDGLARCSAEQRQQVQQWLQNPSQPLADDNPLAQLMQQRAESYAKAMPAKQASTATLVELSLALAANPGPGS